jgi:hypothetical protein
MRTGTIDRRLRTSNGERVTLRALKWEDLDHCVVFINDLVGEKGSEPNLGIAADRKQHSGQDIISTYAGRCPPVYQSCTHTDEGRDLCDQAFAMNSRNTWDCLGIPGKEDTISGLYQVSTRVGKPASVKWIVTG